MVKLSERIRNMDVTVSCCNTLGNREAIADEVEELEEEVELLKDIVEHMRGTYEVSSR